MEHDVRVIDIKEINDYGMWEASINLPYHDDCITVIGGNLQMCVDRVNIIVAAFRAHYAGKES